MYVLTNSARTVLYVGVTNDLARRMREHKRKLYINSFTARYAVNELIYYEVFDSIVLAIAREKELKGWRRDKKEALIAKRNPEWKEIIP